MADDEIADEDQDEREADAITERAIAASKEYRGRHDLMVLAQEADAHAKACLAQLRRATEALPNDLGTPELIAKSRENRTELKRAGKAHSNADDKLLAILYADDGRGCEGFHGGQWPTLGGYPPEWLEGSVTAQL